VNPAIVAANPSSTDVSLSFDAQSATAYVFYTTQAGLQLATYPNIVPGGPQITAAPSPLLFGSVNVGSTSDKTVNVTNTGNADLQLGTISVTGTGFSRNAGGCANNAVLAPQGSCTISVRFAPGSATLHAGTLSVPSNDGNVTVPLTGTGVSAGSNGVDLVVLSGTPVSPASGLPLRGIDNGVPFNVPMTIRNTGNSPSGAFKVKVYFSVDQVANNGGNPPDQLLFTWDVANLNGGETASSTALNVHFNFWPIHASYYVVVKVDADDQVAEGNEGNNTVNTLINVSR
jgi:hypothetical protein